jgi:predicted RNase H-like nuclease (RuvC/YqgF family)
MSLTKNLVRFAVIAGLVGGTAAVVAGPDRIGALFHQTQAKINHQIDRHIEDPVALRTQMRKLEGQYPERIQEVRGDLAELREQAAQLKRELAVSDRVVTLAQADAEEIRGLIARAEEAQAITNVSTDSRPAIVRIVFNEESIPLKDAYSRATRIQQVQHAYTSRANDIQRDLGYMATQEQRLSGLLNQLETEHTEFQSQIWQMERQVDSIARNERLITMMEKRQRTLDENSRYKAHSLDQLSGRFADIRAKQEARMEALGTSTTTLNYEDRAKFDLDARKAYSPSEDLQPLPRTPSVIEIRPEEVEQGESPVKSKPIAMRTGR